MGLKIQSELSWAAAVFKVLVSSLINDLSYRLCLVILGLTALSKGADIAWLGSRPKSFRPWSKGEVTLEDSSPSSSDRAG